MTRHMTDIHGPLSMEPHEVKEDRLPLLTPVVYIEDVKCEDPGLIVFDHNDYGGDFYSVQWMQDRHLSLRNKDQLRVLTPLEFCKVWAKGISYEGVKS